MTARSERQPHLIEEDDPRRPNVLVKLLREGAAPEKGIPAPVFELPGRFPARLCVCQVCGLLFAFPPFAGAWVDGGEDGDERGLRGVGVGFDLESLSLQFSAPWCERDPRKTA